MRQALCLEKMKAFLKQGAIYRRSDFLFLTTNVDRNLAKLTELGLLKKLQNGLYECPRLTDFGPALPNEEQLLKKFLNDDHFVVYSYNLFNSLELGTTQLYNNKIVFNRKRHGDVILGGRKYFLHKWREAPKKLSLEFLLVEMMNRFEDLAEDKNKIMENLKKSFSKFNKKALRFCLLHYGTLSAQKKLLPLF